MIPGDRHHDLFGRLGPDPEDRGAAIARLRAELAEIQVLLDALRARIDQAGDDFGPGSGRPDDDPWVDPAD
jgi:hypothetical protein